MQDILLEIQSRYEVLDPSEKRVADFIALNFPYLPYTSIGTLAEEVGTSKTTINRFCKKIGYAGYRDFKMRILKGITHGSTELMSGADVPKELADQQTISDILSFVIKTGIDTLIETRSLLMPDILEQVVELLLQAEKILLIGVGSSSPVVLDAEHRLTRLGMNCIASTDPHFQIVRSTYLNPRDAIIGISYSGYSRDVFTGLQVARKRGTPIISITSSPYSPIAGIADFLLLSSARKAPFISESIASRMSQMAIIDVLCSTIYLRRSETLLEALEEMETFLAEKRVEDH